MVRPIKPFGCQLVRVTVHARVMSALFFTKNLGEKLGVRILRGHLHNFVYSKKSIRGNMFRMSH